MSLLPAARPYRPFLRFAAIVICAIAAAALYRQFPFQVTGAAMIVSQIALFIETVAFAFVRGMPIPPGLHRAHAVTAITVANVSNIACFAAVYMTAGLIDPAGHRIALSYSDAVYFSLGYWLPIPGPRDILPPPEAQLFNAVQSVSGYAYVGLVGTIAVASYFRGKTR